MKTANITQIFFILILSTTGFSQTTQDPLWEQRSTDYIDWSDHVRRELYVLAPALLNSLPKDSGVYCPNYKNLTLIQREDFWIYLLSAMARYESNFNPNLKYKESFYDNNGKNVISRGLLQISIESSRGYNCGFVNENEIHDPFKNLSCGLRILNKWMINDGYIGSRVLRSWRGGARYWSVLRSNGSSQKAIVKLTNALNYCKN